MSAFWKAFHKGRVGRLTDEELDSISRGLTPFRFLPGAKSMAPFSKTASSWGRGRSFGGTSKAKRRLTWGGTLARGYGRATFRRGYDRTGGFYGRYSGRNAELKFHDIDVDDAVVAQNGTILNGGSINLIGQGTGESVRIGRKCTIRKIGWKWTMQNSSIATANAQNVIRLILYLDKQANGATATITDILESNSFISHRNLANSGRFQILMDRNYTFNPSIGGNGTALDTAGMDKAGSFYRNVNIPLEFTGTATPADITEIRSNNLGVLILGKQNINSTVFASKMRLRFSDQ